MHRRIATALAAGLMLQGTLAFADASATATFSNITVELIDLDPGDGIAPSVAFSGFSSVQAFTDFTPTSQTLDVGGNGATSFGTVSATAPASTHNGASASFAGDVYGGTGMAATSAWAQGLATPVQGFTEGAGETIFGNFDASPGTGFVLSPHTELIISGLADLEGVTTPGGDGQQTFSDFDMYIADTEGGPRRSEADLQAMLDGSSPAATVSDQMQLSVSFSNVDATAYSGYFLGKLDAFAISMVPETPTAILLLVALASMVFGAKVRRRT